jgi:NAD+ synthase (glutamine-hydrolysing)
MQQVSVGCCTLNQWALDFSGNTERIIQSIRSAKVSGCHIRVGPELEVSGYGCNDHFLEPGHHYIPCFFFYI